MNGGAPGVEVQAQRWEAAMASGGTSVDHVYRCILDQVRPLGAIEAALDFGAGRGHLAAALCDLPSVARVETVDLLRYLDQVEHPKLSWFAADLNERLPVEDCRYDLVVAAEVIEHLENPRHVARELHRVLKPGGTAILSTPNNESLRSLLSLGVRGHYVAFLNGSYPAHITALLRRDLQRVLAEAGFIDISFHFTRHGSVPVLTRLNWQRVSFGLLRGVRYSDNVVCVGRRPIAGAGERGEE